MRLIRRYLGTFILASALLGVATDDVRAQTPLPDNRVGQEIPGVPPMLQRLEQGVEDVGPLSDTLRAVDMTVDLRTPVGFSSVYRVPGRPDLLMRSSGAVYAIFPQSAYVETDRGTVALVPAGTIFSIGVPHESTLPQQSLMPTLVEPARTPLVAGNPGLRRQPRVYTLVMTDTRGRVIDPLATAGMDDARPQQIIAAKPPEPGTILRTIATDEEYRTQRVAELLRQAAEAAREREQ